MAIQPTLLVTQQIVFNLFKFKVTLEYTSASHWGFAGSGGHCFFVRVLIQKVIIVFNMDLLHLLSLCSYLLACLLSSCE
jgi:hypothetical protein